MAGSQAKNAVSEVRLSLLQKDDSGKHTKHVAVEVTDQAVCDAIVSALGVDFDKAADAAKLEIKPQQAKKTA